MIVQRLADAPDVAESKMTFEDIAHIRQGEVGVADDAVRKAVPVGDALQPSGLADRIGRIVTDVEMHRLDHVLAAAIGQEMLDQIAAADRGIVAESARLHPVLQPGIAMGLEIIEMVMGIDDREMVRVRSGRAARADAGLDRRAGYRGRRSRRSPCRASGPGGGRRAAGRRDLPLSAARTADLVRRVRLDPVPVAGHAGIGGRPAPRRAYADDRRHRP